jgi:menaquinone-specific isochorismate synthase
MACNLAESFEISDFLQEGAFYRSYGDGRDPRVHFWWGSASDHASENRENTVFYMPFFGTQVQAKIYAKSLSCTLAEFKQLLSTFVAAQDAQETSKKTPEKLNLRWAGPSEASFERSFQTIKGKILREELDKAVPVVCKKAKLNSPQDFRGRLQAQKILKALEAPEALHVFGLWDRREGVLGATPEILFRRQGRSLTSMALAGTCPKKDLDNRIPLLKDEKELKEHQAVVDDLMKKLAHFGRVQAGAPHVLELPTLLHLKSDLFVEDFRGDEQEVIFSLHPTPALGVSPRNYGHHWMKQLPDQQDRGLFGAPLAFPLGPDDLICLVVIRSLFWKEEELSIYSGCGLVALSDFAQEWKELLAKLDSIENLLGLDRL